MGNVLPTNDALLIAAIFSRDLVAIDWAKERLTAEWGAIVLASRLYDHEETRFYEKTMGAGLKKCFVAMQQLIDPATLPSCKLASNAWEEEGAKRLASDVARPVNIDPGYITEAKLVLATTKDRDHRIYLSQGIFAEVTLHFQAGKWQPRPWTYPDYQRADYHEFFSQCRDYLRSQKMRPRSTD